MSTCQRAGSKSVPLALVTLMAVSPLLARTEVNRPDNKYSLADDVRLGQEAAADVEKQLPLLHDRTVGSYVKSVGRRLANAIPTRFQEDAFDYSFKVVNVSDANAFALPGGPTYVNRGMIETARSEGELAGVLAHELSHVALRHGTAQATKATPYQWGALAGAVVGTIIGGRTGSVVSQGTQLGLGTAFLRFSRQYERQADLLGAHIMAQAGYDPHEMANMFETLEARNGSGGLEFLSSHPNPGNRREYIAQEAQTLQVHDPVGASGGFSRVQARLKRMEPAPTTAQVHEHRR